MDEERIDIKGRGNDKKRKAKRIPNKKKIITEGVIYCKKNKNEIDKTINEYAYKDGIKDNEFNKDKSKNIGLGKYDIDRILKECQRKGGTYPPADVMEMFKKTLEGLEVRESRVAAWSKMKVRGLWLKKGYKVKRGMVIGVYGGKITIGVGLYVLQLEYEDGQKFRVDAEEAEGKTGIFGMINEDIHNREINAHFEEMGLIRIVKNLIGPTEILTDYGPEYDWDELKWIGYKALKEEMGWMEEWVNELKARNMKEARKGCRLEKHMARIIDGEVEAEELHSTKQKEGRKSLETFLTSGEEMEWYFFGNFGGERKKYENVDIGRVDKRVSGLKRYAQRWLEEDVITCEFKEVRRLNENVNSICNMIEEARKTIGRHGKGNREEVITGGIEIEREIRLTENGKGIRIGVEDQENKGNEEEKGEENSGEKEEEIIFTAVTPTRDKEPTAMKGRVKVTMALGSGGKRREHLRIINSCKNAEELEARTALMRIWRVEITHEQEEDKVRADGFCGYAAMTDIIRGVERKLDMRLRRDRLEVGMAIREMINKAPGSIRSG